MQTDERRDSIFRQIQDASVRVGTTAWSSFCVPGVDGSTTISSSSTPLGREGSVIGTVDCSGRVVQEDSGFPDRFFSLLQVIKSRAWG